MPVRVPTALVVLVVGVGLGVLVLALSSGPSSGPAAAPPRAGASAAPGQDGSLAVLHDWDRRRGAAWARGDEAALGRLYVPGSAARRADLALLRRYRARGLVVRGMSMQVLRARVLVVRPRALVLEVSDRLAAAVAGTFDDPAVARSLPAGSVTTHVLRFRRVGTDWLLASVSAAR